MPHSEIHNKKKKTNLTILGLIGAFFVLFWAITMIKIGAQSKVPAPNAISSAEISAEVDAQ